LIKTLVGNVPNKTSKFHSEKELKTDLVKSLWSDGSGKQIDKKSWSVFFNSSFFGKKFEIL